MALLVVTIGFLWFVSLPLSIAGLVCGLLGRQKVDRGEVEGGRGMSQAGFVVGIVGLILHLVALVVIVLLLGLLLGAANEIEIEGPDRRPGLDRSSLSAAAATGLWGRRREASPRAVDVPPRAARALWRPRRTGPAAPAGASLSAILGRPPMTDAFVKQYLMTAGPTPLPPRVSQVMAEPILYHRAPAFIEVYARCLERLPRVFETAGDVLCFAASGTGAMESAVSNLTRPGEPAVVASCGKFGERWVELCDAYGADTRHLDVEWGSRVDPADLDRALAESGGASVVFTTLSETSTGVVNDVRALAETAHRHGALIAVDAVSALGAVPVRQDAWGLDVVVAGSQKALMSPPGLAFTSASEAALERAAGAGPGRYYFDWHRTAAGQRKDPPDSPFTPAVGLFMALDVALEMIEEEGLDQVHARHRLLGAAAREAARALDLELFGPDDDNANVVTAVRLPDAIDGAGVPKLMRDRFGITVAGGQGALKGKIVRIAHCGYFGAFDVLTAVAALEMTLRELGQEVELGTGVGAAQQVFSGAGVPAGAPA